MFEITALDYDCPPLHPYVYTSCERLSIYGQLKNTNNHPPPVKKSAFIICKVLQCLCERSRCLLIACLLLQRSCWANGDLANSEKVPSLSQPFPVFDIIVYSPKTHWSVSCPQPGWHTSHATYLKHKVHTFWLWTCTKECFCSWMQSHRLPQIMPSFFITCVVFTVMKHWPVLASEFQLKSVICQLKHGMGPQVFNLNEDSFKIVSNRQRRRPPSVVSSFIQISQFFHILILTSIVYVKGCHIFSG